MLSRLMKSKTVWTAVIGIITAAGAGVRGDLPWNEVVQLIFAGLIAIGFRDGMAKGGK
jgi:hypothetical protein